MPTKKEATPSSAKAATAKKAESKKSVIERKAPGASAARETKPVRIDKAAPEKPAAALTRIMAYVDIGPGNTLFLRGEGGGLSWEAGVPMEYIGGDCWSWSARSGQDVTFKLLINDHQWSTGDNLTVAESDTATVMPAF